MCEKFSIFLPVHNTEIAGISMGDSVSGYIWMRGRSDINRKYKFRGYKNITDRFPEYKEHASANVTGLPIYGQTVYVRLFSKVSGVWQTSDYTYVAAGPAALTAPTPGTQRLVASSSHTNGSRKKLA